MPQDMRRTGEGHPDFFKPVDFDHRSGVVKSVIVKLSSLRKKYVFQSRVNFTTLAYDRVIATTFHTRGCGAGARSYVKLDY